MVLPATEQHAGEEERHDTIDLLESQERPAAIHAAAGPAATAA
jgi:hypothetical protein